MRIALVGYGKMGAALLARWVQANPPPHQFTVVDPAIRPETSRAGAAGEAVFLNSPPDGDVRFDLVVAAVKPQHLDDVLPLYADRLTDDGFVASIAAGASLSRLRALSGAPVVRVMPNLPTSVGAGVVGLCADDATTSSQRAALDELMATTGSTIWVDTEDQLDRLTAVSGSGPGYVLEFARAYVAAASDLGFSDADAFQLVMDTLAGTIALARQSAESLPALRDSVTSPGGTTAAGLQAFNGDAEMDRRMASTLQAAYARAVALR